MCSIITHFWCTKISQNFSYPQAGSRQKGNFMYKWYRKCMFEVCLNYVCEKMWSKKYIKYCKMFIKYALTPLRMDKKKDIKKHSSKHGARETTRRRFVIFCIIFCVDSIKGDAQKKTEKENRTRKHLQHQKHQKNCWNRQNSSLCVLCLVILYIFWKNWNTKGPMRVWRQLALGYERDVTPREWLVLC